MELTPEQGPSDADDTALPPEVLVRFGMRLRQARLARDLTQKQIGDRAGLSRSLVVEVEHGRRNLTLEAADKLAHAVRTDLQKLLRPLTTVTKARGHK